MKTKMSIIIVAIALLKGFGVNAQTGIYLNAADFKNGKLTAESKTDGKVRINSFLGTSSRFTVKHNGKKSTYSKDRVYGYRNNEGKVYRIYNGATYEIAEAGPVFIYKQDEHIAQSKGYKVENRYYFSVTAEGKILPLTPANLKYAYRDNSEYTDLLDGAISTGTISEWDALHKTFKLNYLFTKTTK